MSARPAVARRGAAPARVEAVIRELDDDGRGVTDIAGRSTRVEGALEGERVVIDVFRRRRRFDEARLVAVLDPSAERVRPDCPHFHVCGGCRFQHLTIEAQRRRKERALNQALARYGVPQPDTRLPPIAGRGQGYRRKARLGVRHVPGKGGALVGFREKRGNLIADIGQCEVLVPSIGQRIGALRELVTGLEARARLPQIEVAAGDDVTAVILRHLDPLSESDRNAIRDFADRNNLLVYLQPGGLDSVTPLRSGDPEKLCYRLPEFNIELMFGPADFIQVNAAINRALVSSAVALLDLRREDLALDLYCGIGNFSLAIARQAGEVTGLEASAEMVAAAERNASFNAISNARFELADLDDPGNVDTVLSRPWTKMLLDPPRSGAAALVDRLGPHLPKRIVYVSCSPQSFARDAAVLVGQHGYRLERAGIVDMFPHTGHVEVIAQFSARGAS